MLDRKTHGIIIAADVDSLSRLQQISDLASDSPDVVGIKIGFALVLRYGLRRVVDAVKGSADVSIIYDHQKAATDIPQTGKLFADACRDGGVDSIIFFPQAGPKTMQGYVSAAKECGLTPIVGLVMTHDAYLQSEGGYIVDDAPELMARAAIDLGVKHFVLPGTKPNIIERFARRLLEALGEVSILMPGIGAQGGSLQIAFQAARPHRSYAIIGSAIYSSNDPLKALRQFVEEARTWQRT